MSALDEVRAMMIFARVVDEGGFSAAARKMGLSRAAISHQIRQLETRLGVPLLRRSTRSFSLTDAGARYYDSCRTISLEAEAARKRVEELRDDPVGKISLTCSVHLGTLRIVPILDRFRQTYPGVSIDVHLSDEVVDLIGRGIDIAVRSGPLKNSELKNFKLYQTHRIIAASQSYVSKFGLPESPDDLSEHEWVMYSRVPETLTLQCADGTRNIRVSGSVRVDNATARLQFLRGGHGLAVVPLCDVQQEIDNGELIRVLPDCKLPDLEIYAVYPGGVTRSAKVQSLLDYMRREMREIDISRNGQVQSDSHIDHS
ncbi:MAG: LysR family transcriptional regulator [Thalassospira sp.]|uniref:LysR family transcriptional regulator n=1 Tax=Thalassospira sp. UBA4513 TaxID=1947675 RepID=UPI000C5F5E04|nr:LysR family transcriptional regulator [Thalassospira sp. UBA4513]MBE72202.1 LysR family transcriptional regulator [Thalassospira sp.]|tara:strand:- start:2676 stop:3617 length:942 start_codon:yes stop_codon:yes gene_type:complete